MSFLTANWNNLALINYAIDPEILKPYIPKGTELDFYNNTCYVSLVGFLFNNTKLLGLPIPFHRNFEEVNLRFYVKCKEGNEWKRGVVSIKELVPKSALTLIANTVYKEHYQTVPMKHVIKETDSSFSFNYSWEMNNKWQHINIKTSNELSPILANTEEEFICEHYFGYTKHKDQTFEYEVKHPRWNN
ncbi:YqjF family protein [Pseudofulvibacter geojedonensis]|uniref:YqjF family protein n=1 Tax=Pseudofulvibacter geojedonensis TaxID=1123758 RepID=A0ABW3I5U2_9FLAO